jgi:hypothetical protein
MRAVESQEWLFDEAGHAGREHLDPGCVALYDAKARVDPSEASSDWSASASTQTAR